MSDAKLKRYELTVHWCNREPKKYSVLALNRTIAILVAVRVNCESSSEMYDHNKTEKTVKMIEN